MKIQSKAEFFNLWRRNVLGNRTRLWSDPYHALSDAWALGIKEIGFREIGKAGGGHWEKVPRNSLIDTAKRWQQAGRKFMMDDGAPDEYRTIQGEVCRTFRGLEGFIGRSNLPMRQAIANGDLTHRNYLETYILLNTYMDPSSRDDVDAIFELYPDATIEFTCFSVDVGVIPGRNVLLWEVRDY